MPHEFTLSYAGNITLYVPRREGYEAAVELETTRYATAEVEARQMGFEPRWNV